MSIFDVVLNTDEITVLSTPTSIDVAFDYGATGERGSKIFAGSGNPNIDISWGSIELLPYDLFINISANSKFSWLYQYVSKPTGFTWEAILKLQPSIFSKKITTTFDAFGLTTINIPLSDIVSDTTYADPEKYIVQITGMTTNPIALTINSKSIVSTNLQIVVEAVTCSSLTWSALTGAQDLMLNVTVI
jgi:hypothetical protein